MKRIFSGCMMVSVLIGASAHALIKPLPAKGPDSRTVTVRHIDAKGEGRPLGTLTLRNSEHGLLITPNLKGLTPGLHGFHLHDNPSCKPGVKDGKTQAGIAAGDHLGAKAAHTGGHQGPYHNSGHLGDLPALYVAPDGSATQPVLAPRLKVKDAIGHSVMIHKGGDNYSDKPKPLGGGGERVACGVIK